VAEELRDLYLTRSDDAEKLENELDEKLERWTPIRDELLEAFADFAGELPDKCAASIASTFISKPPVCTPPSSSGRRHAWERMAGRSACK